MKDPMTVTIDPNGLLVTVGWPNRSLSPNARVHRMKLARAKRQSRDEAYLLAYSALRAKPVSPSLGTPKLDVVIIARPAVRRSRDEDNLIASLKATLDGIATAIGIDDSRFHIQPLIITDPDKANPRIEIRIQEQGK